MDTVARIEQANPHPVLELTLGGRVRRVRVLGLRESARWCTAHRALLLDWMQRAKAAGGEGMLEVSVESMIEQMEPIVSAVFDYLKLAMPAAEYAEADAEADFGEMIAALGEITPRAMRFSRATKVEEAPSETTSVADANSPNGDGPTS